MSSPLSRATSKNFDSAEDLIAALAALAEVRPRGWVVGPGGIVHRVQGLGKGNRDGSAFFFIAPDGDDGYIAGAVLHHYGPLSETLDGKRFIKHRLMGERGLRHFATVEEAKAMIDAGPALAGVGFGSRRFQWMPAIAGYPSRQDTGWYRVRPGKYGHPGPNFACAWVRLRCVYDERSDRYGERYNLVVARHRRTRSWGAVWYVYRGDERRRALGVFSTRKAAQAAADQFIDSRG